MNGLNIPGPRSFSGMDYPETKKKRNFAGNIFLAAMLTVLCIYILKNSSGFTTPTPMHSMHFAAVAYVGESILEPLRYYHNITSNTVVVLEAMAAHGVKTLIYSMIFYFYFSILISTAKKMAEDVILDFLKNSVMAVMILRYFKVIGSDRESRLGEVSRLELGSIVEYQGLVKGTDYSIADGTCIRDYIDITDLVDAHVKALAKARSIEEFVEACKKATLAPCPKWP
ncbi:hypothetical protein MKX03_037932 [Papaver bracteatum]|nr:hypothetical protein MKX03_037932 [Papaver bracteatum]